MDYQNHVTIESGKRSAKSCIGSMRITVYDVLGWLVSGMSEAEILLDYPELTGDDISACLAFAADHERKISTIVSA